jgi:macrolide transport system ATP-binding/permease protein
MELIRLDDLHKTYHLGEVEVQVLRGVSLSIARGEMVALMGVSGSGKTTLMNILGCLDRPTSGRYWFDGQEMSGLAPNQRARVRSEKIGFVFQNFNLLRRTTAFDNVLMPLEYGPRRARTRHGRRLAQLLLAQVGLTEHFHHEPSQMSGGQQQRVAIARALVNRPMLILADEPTGNLDSHTGAEILRMFQQLNAEGITVILVTHDPKVAACAHRTIRIEDGQIQTEADGAAGSYTDEQFQAEGHGPATASRAVPGGGAEVAVEVDAGAASGPAVATLDPCEPAGPKPRTATPPRSVASRPGPVLPAIVPQTFRTAFGALWRNKMRTTLTALGIIIGVGAVIAMMEIGQGSKVAIENTIASMGADALMIHSEAVTKAGVSYGAGSTLTLTPEDGDEILRQCPAVAEVAPLVRARAQVIRGNRNWVPAQICGTTPSFLAVRDWHDFSEGHMFTDRDVNNANKVCVIGETLRNELFVDESPVGKDMRIQNVSFTVIGVLGRRGANMMGTDQDDIVVAPWTTVKYRLSGSTAFAATPASSSGTAGQVNTVSNLYPGAPPLYCSRSTADLANTPQLVRFDNIDHMYAKAVSARAISQAIEEISALLRQRHRIGTDEPDDFRVNDMAEVSKALASTSQLMGALLLVVALVSLVVGGVGITNMMLVSVTERTREIGLRMAVGARDHDILRQFLIEAVVLCLFGGALGILLGRVTSIVVRSVMQWPTEPSLLAIVAAAAISAGVGVLFGLYPAWKASRLDPIEALRYE